MEELEYVRKRTDNPPKWRPEPGTDPWLVGTFWPRRSRKRLGKLGMFELVPGSLNFSSVTQCRKQVRCSEALSHVP